MRQILNQQHLLVGLDYYIRFLMLDKLDHRVFL